MMTRLLVGILTPAIRAKLFLHLAAPEHGAETPKTSGGGRPLSRDPKRKRARSHKAAPGPRTIRDGGYLVAQRGRVNRQVAVRASVRARRIVQKANFSKGFLEKRKPCRPTRGVSRIGRPGVSARRSSRSIPARRCSTSHAQGSPISPMSVSRKRLS